MTYIHELPDWPNFTWETSALARPLAAVRHRQGRLLGRMEALGLVLRTEASLATLTADVVTSSAIENEALDGAEVRSSIARRLGIALNNPVRPGRDVEGIVEMMLDATQRHAEPLSADRLFAWHAALFPTGLSGLKRITTGRWRPEQAGPMQVVSGPIGRERIHFVAPAAQRIEGEMRWFLDWFNRPEDLDPILKAAVAHLWFLTIHPFEDGNGRIARAIADMALARADGTSERFYSMSAQIQTERANYYAEIEAQQRGTLDVTAWLTWFLACLDRALDRAEQALETVTYKAKLWEAAGRVPLNVRQRKVLERLLSDFQGPLTNAKYIRIAKTSADTALRDIHEMIAWKLLVQNPGGGRSTSYRLATLAELIA